MEKIGLIAGGGKLPVIFAREVRRKRKGVKVIGFAIRNMASSELGTSCDRVHWFGIGEFKKCFLLFFIERIKKIVMLGKVDKSVVYSNVKKDEKAAHFLQNTTGKSDYALLDGVTRELSKRGIEVINGIDYLPELLPTKGVLTKRHPTKREEEDVLFGFKIAKEIARLDVGQTIVVKDKTVVSVEAMEGTDQTIERAIRLCNGGFVVIKVSRPEQDMRWDVPVVGPETVSMIAEHKGKVLAIEEKRMFLIEKETCVDIADSKGISIVVV